MNEVPHMLLPNFVKSSEESIKKLVYFRHPHPKSNIKKKQGKSAIDPMFN
jgi:hypothetical protein